MKYFVIELIAFAGLTFLVSFLRPLYLLQDDRLIDGMVGAEVFQSVHKSGTTFSAKTIVIGDSVANQLFSNLVEGGDPESLACNGYITMVGYHVLTKQALAHNPQIEHVLLIIHPSCFRIEFQNRFAFHYFLKPFYQQRFLDDFTPEALLKVDEVPLNQLVWLPQVRTSNWSPDWDVQELPLGPSEPAMTSMTRDYFHRLLEMLRSRDIQVTVLCPPIHPRFARYVERLKQDVEDDLVLKEVMKDYFASVRLEDASVFTDEVHFRHPAEYVDEILQAMDEAK